MLVKIIVHAMPGAVRDAVHRQRPALERLKSARRLLSFPMLPLPPTPEGPDFLVNLPVVRARRNGALTSVP